VVGVNCLQADEDIRPEILKIDEDLERAQVERVQAVRAERAAQPAKDAIEVLHAAARGDDNVMPHILRAVTAECTLG